MKTKLANLLKMKQEQRSTLNKSMIEADTKEERAAIGETLAALEKEIAEVQAMLAEIDDPAGDEGEGAQRGLNVIASMQTRGAQSTQDADLEQRKAFKNFIATGKRSAELRGDGSDRNTTTDAASVIPENLLNRIIEKIESVGTIYNLVTKTSYPVGQTIPKEATKPVASWVGRNTTSLASSTSGEGETSTIQKGVTLDTAIVFANFKLRCEVAMTEEVATMALSSFEALFVKNVALAMLRAIEFAIVDGDGYGMPTGILATTAPTGQAIEIAAADELDFATLCAIEGAVPAEKEAGAKWVMTKKTFMSFVGMLDDVGQPIARTNYGINGKPERTLLGRDVILYAPQTGSKIGNYAADVDEDTLFAFIFDFNDYVLNNNYDLGIQHKIDWDNEDHRTKAVAAYDGKVIDATSLVTVTKKAS